MPAMNFKHWSDYLKEIDQCLSDSAKQSCWYAETKQPYVDLLCVPAITYSNLATGLIHRQFRHIKFLDAQTSTPNHQNFVKYLKSATQTTFQHHHTTGHIPEVIDLDKEAREYIDNLVDRSKANLYEQSYSRCRRNQYDRKLLTIHVQLKPKETHYIEFDRSGQPAPIDPRIISPINDKHAFPANLWGYLLKKYLPPLVQGLGLNISDV